MGKNTNNFCISVNVLLKLEKVKVALREKYDLVWTDFIVLCSLMEFEETNYVVTADLVKHIGRNRVWIYASLRRLHEKP